MTGKQAGRDRNGFTLAELTIVVLIVGIMAAVAVPTSVRSISQFRAEAAAKRIAADLMYARQTAIRQGQSSFVAFSVLLNGYGMGGVPNPNRSSKDYIVDLSSTEYPVQLLAADFGGTLHVTFDMNGRPNSGGYVTVQSNEYQKLVVLDAVTGHATVQ